MHVRPEGQLFISDALLAHSEPPQHSLAQTPASPSTMREGSTVGALSLGIGALSFPAGRAVVGSRWTPKRSAAAAAPSVIAAPWVSHGDTAGARAARF